MTNHSKHDRLVEDAQRAIDRRPPRLKNLAEVAADPDRPWATSKGQLVRLCALGQLAHRRIGKTNWVSDEDLDAYEASCYVDSAAAS